MPIETSDCLQSFGFEDFELENPQHSVPKRCPVKGCSTSLVESPYLKGQKPFCPEHGIRLHSGTFVYWNGPERKAQGQLRNFQIRRDLAAEIALGSVAKAESHRLGYEMSEDALSWSVFVGLAEAGKLREIAAFLTGHEVPAYPDLYLWGERIDVTTRSRALFQPLIRIRDRLEPDIRRFKTEPDIMLVVDDQLVISVEAKFGSGNPLAYEGESAKGEKPSARGALLARYLGPGVSDETRRSLQQQAIGNTFHSQLFRNIVFASEMAAGCDWHVTNLVSSTQRGKDSDRYSYGDPTKSVLCYLSPHHKQCFTYRTWEDLHRAVIKGDKSLAHLDRYLRAKSAHYRRAFEMV